MQALVQGLDGQRLKCNLKGLYCMGNSMLLRKATAIYRLSQDYDNLLTAPWHIYSHTRRSGLDAFSPRLRG